jgi:hypothetical protein
MFGHPSTTTAKTHHVLDDGFTILADRLLHVRLIGAALTNALLATIQLDGNQLIGVFATGFALRH